MRKRSSKGGGAQRSIQVHLMVNEEEAAMIRAYHDDVERMESETAGHGITGPVHYALHMLPEHGEEMVSMTVKLPKSQLEKVTETARRYHISRSEYVRRQLAGAV